MSGTAIHLDCLLARRVRGVETAARREILIGIVSALFFAAVVSLRFAYYPWGVLLWCAVVLYRFRGDLLRPVAGEMAATGLAHYRSVLERRRDHLRHAWLRQGPLVLSSQWPAASTRARRARMTRSRFPLDEAGELGRPDRFTIPPRTPNQAKLPGRETPNAYALSSG